MHKAKFVKEIEVEDPDTGNIIGLSVYKDEASEGMFAIDSSFISEFELTTINSPFNKGKLKLIGD